MYTLLIKCASCSATARFVDHHELNINHAAKTVHVVTEFTSILEGVAHGDSFNKVILSDGKFICAYLIASMSVISTIKLRYAGQLTFTSSVQGFTALALS